MGSISSTTKKKALYSSNKYVLPFYLLIFRYMKGNKKLQLLTSYNKTNTNREVEFSSQTVPNLPSKSQEKELSTM